MDLFALQILKNVAFYKETFTEMFEAGEITEEQYDKAMANLLDELACLGEYMESKKCS